MRSGTSRSLGAAWLIVSIACTAAPATHAAQDRSDVTAAQAERWLKPGRKAAEQGDYTRARELTEAALSRVGKQLSSEHWLRAYLLNDLARWKTAAGARDEALPDAEGALEIARAAFSEDPSRIAYFALDVGTLQFQLSHCAAAESVLAGSLATLPPSPQRERIALAYARLLWTMGDVARARALVQSQTSQSEAGALLLAQLDLDSGQLAAARRKLDDYRQQHALTPEETRWPAPYLEAELAHALATSDLPLALSRAQRLLKLSEPSADAAARHRLGQVLSLMGQFAQAERELSASLQGFAHSDGDASPAAANVYHDLAWVYRLLGDYPRSEFSFERALASAGRCSRPGDPMLALMLRERAMLRIEQGKIPDALVDIDAATRQLRNTDADVRVLRGLLIASRAFALDQQGDLPGSEAAMQSALALIAAAEGPDSLNLPLGYVHLADLAYRRRRFDAAQRNSTAALAILERRGTQSIWGTGAALSVRGAASAGIRAAASYWSDVARFIDVTERSLAPNGGASSANQSEIELARLQAERLLAAAPHDSTPQLATLARLMQLPHISDATASLQAAALESGDLPRNVRALVRERAELLERSQSLRSSLLLTQQRGQAIDAVSVAALGAALERLASTDDALLRASPAVAGQLLQRAIDPADVQRHLGERESILLQVVTEHAVHALLIGKTTLLHRSAPMTRQQIRADVRHLRRALDLSLPSSQRLAFDAVRANALYQSSVGLFARELVGRDQLIVVADDAYQSIPWSILVDRLDTSGRARSFLADRVAITTVPSLQSFLALRSVAARPAAPRTYAGFADPQIASFRDARDGAQGQELAALELVGQLPPLPEARAEIGQMARTLGGRPQLYVGQQVTEQTVRAAHLDQFRIVSFATHGVMAGEIPGLSEPALVLTRPATNGRAGDDGLLTASEIAQLSLHADLVILSACNTGRINSKAGITGISGLARGFFAAGARSLLVSHWAVASDATATLLAKTVELLAADPRPGKAEALRRAMLWMRDSSPGGNYSQPAFWGGFSLVGESVTLATP